MTNGNANLSSKDTNTETSPHWSITGSVNCLPIGTHLAEFEITGVVGEGGFGNVYLAFDHSLQRTVAIKEYMPVALASRGADNAVLVQTKRHKETFETGMNSFINEARLLAQFDHPALIKVYRFWEQNNTAYMAMRYYEGQTFKNIVAKHPEVVSEAWLKPILKPILEALETLYKIQILHRDISPDNIMIQTNGEAVLLDFGAARQILGDMSQALTVILKPGYAPVEQYAEDSDMKQGPWTDIYALSAVMYFAIARKVPPTSVTRLLKDPIELLQNSARPGFSKEFLAAIDKGMAVKPDERPQSVAEFSKLLGINKAGPTQPTSLLSAKSSAAQKKASTNAKPGDAHGHKSKSAPSATKVSNKGSWVLIAAGVIAAAIGIYHMSHRPFDSKAAAETTPSATMNANDSGSGAAQPAQSTASTSLPETGKSDESAGAPPLPAQQANATLEEGANRAKPTPAAIAVSSKPGSAGTLGVNTAPPNAIKPVPPAVGTDNSRTAPENAQTDGTPAKATVAFRLSIRPWATVLVDGSMKGVSPPMKRLLLSAGKHQIRLVNPSFPDHTVDILVDGKKKSGAIDYDFSPQ